jgi:hypothetical protein
VAVAGPGQVLVPEEYPAAAGLELAVLARELVGAEVAQHRLQDFGTAEQRRAAREDLGAVPGAVQVPELALVEARAKVRAEEARVRAAAVGRAKVLVAVLAGVAEEQGKAGRVSVALAVGVPAQVLEEGRATGQPGLALEERALVGVQDPEGVVALGWVQLEQGLLERAAVAQKLRAAGRRR